MLKRKNTPNWTYLGKQLTHPYVGKKTTNTVVFNLQDKDNALGNHHYIHKNVELALATVVPNNVRNTTKLLDQAISDAFLHNIDQVHEALRPYAEHDMKVVDKVGELAAFLLLIESDQAAWMYFDTPRPIPRDRDGRPIREQVPPIYIDPNYIDYSKYGTTTSNVYYSTSTSTNW